MSDMSVEHVYLCCIAGAITAASFHPDLKTSFLCLWVGQILVGFLSFTVGCETLGMMQCLVATISTLCLLFFYILVYTPSAVVSFWSFKKIFLYGSFFLIMLALVFFSKQLFLFWTAETGFFQSLHGLKDLSFSLMQHHFAVLLLIPLIVFVAVIGGGSICRNEGGDDD